MISTLRVLSVGSDASGAKIRDSLLRRSKCRLYVATSTWDISVLLGGREFDVAVVDNTFSPQRATVLCAYIRQRWPVAKLLLITSAAGRSTCTLCDERISPRASGEAILAAIERLAACARRARMISRKSVNFRLNDSHMPPFGPTLSQQARRSQCSAY